MDCTYGNAYSNPKKLGLEIIKTIDDDRARNEYGFKMLILWRHMETGRLFWAQDSGCSCPAPFETAFSLDRLNEITPGNRMEFSREALEFAGSDQELHYEVMTMLSWVSKHFNRR